MQFEFTGKYKTIPAVLMGLGAASIAYGFMGGDATRSWASILLGNYFFLTVALAATFFLAVQYVAEVGWSAVIKRVLMSFGTYLIPACILMVVIFIVGHHDIYSWTHEEYYVKGGKFFDEVLDGKKGYLNMPFYIGRLIFYGIIWAGCAYLMRKNSLAEETMGGVVSYNKNVRVATTFLVCFAITSSTASWDVIMSIDAHWFSTLFGWYSFASMFVTALSFIAIIVIHLKRKGHLPHVNENHIHDLGKFIFAFSIFWTYLWFSQFMLYWYANLPEEVVYFMQRQDHYRVFFIGNLFINFLAPFLIFMTRDAKRKETSVLVVSIIVIVGHWFDYFQMIMPGTVGPHWHMGIVEIGTSVFFLGLFLYVLFGSLAKTPLFASKHPMIEESKHFHI